MNDRLVDQIARAVLYEGYVLYPYRPTSVKNRQRWTFGGIYPPAFSRQQAGSDPCMMQAQCILRTGNEPTLCVSVRFLHLVWRQIEKMNSDGSFAPVAALEIDGSCFQTWQEATEREIELRDDLTSLRNGNRSFRFEGSQEVEPLQGANGRIVGQIVRRKEALNGSIQFRVDRNRDNIAILTIQICNETPMDQPGQISRDDAQMRCMVSSHLVLHIQDGEFISLTDSPESLRQIADGCQNIGCWPVLVGEPGQTDTLLCSPIVLPDYPQVARESPGDLFDGTEIDEILTLRILTLTDEEKRVANSADPRAAAMLARTQSLAREQLMNLHGTFRGLAAAAKEESHA